MTDGHKVFVSSTCYDLIDLRAEVERGLRDMGLSPVLSDRGTSDFKLAQDQNSVETCLVNVDDCDHFILILSQRYGPTLESYGYGELSATHVEYNRALDRKKPVYFYVRDHLKADYDHWRKNPTAENRYPWCKGKDDAIKLFSFIDQRTQPPGSTEVRNNWIQTFQSSVDLVQQIRKDLAAPAGGALLQHLAETGQLPEIEIEKATLEMALAMDGSRKLDCLSITYQEVGPVSPYDLKVGLKQPNDKGSVTESDGGRPGWTGKSSPVIRGRQYEVSFRNVVNEQSRAPFGVLEFLYTIGNGWRVAQIFHLDGPIGNGNSSWVPAKNMGKRLISTSPVLCQAPENPWDVNPSGRG